jgi:hypothetical protein
MRFQILLSNIALVAATAACATAGATYQSGVAPKTFDRPPFYAGNAAPSSGSPVVHLAIRYQRGAEQAPLFEPKGDAGSPAATLVAEMNAFLDSLAVSKRAAASATEVGTPPDVRFGCPVDAAGDCTEEGEVQGDGSNRRLELSVGRPSQEWITWLGGALDASTDQALLITLELGQYWPRQKGLSMSKEVQLGTNYSVSVPWLTSLEKPVAVVQLTGAVVGRDGKAVRIGAEGMMAKRTNIGLSALGAQMLVSDDDIEKLRSARREDLPGQPLVWQVALRTLVGQLTGRTDLAVR